MKSHDTLMLWGLATGELEPGDACLTEDHLGDCPECREELVAVNSVRALAEQARTAAPEIFWGTVDEAVANLVEARTAKSAGLSGSSWRLGLLPIALFGLSLVVFGVKGLLPGLAEAASAAPMAVAPAAEPQPSSPSVISASDAIRLRDGARLTEGAALTAGDLLRTGRSGLLLARMPDSSTLRLGPDSQLKLVRAGADELALLLEHGRVAVQARRAPRGFEVVTGSFHVRGAGAILSVTSLRGGIEVAVSSGRAHVERPNALPMLVDAGHRVIFSASTNRALPVTLTRENESELAEIAAVPSGRMAWATAPKSSDELVEVEPLTPLLSSSHAKKAPVAAAERVPEMEFSAFPQSTPVVEPPSAPVVEPVAPLAVAAPVAEPPQAPAPIAIAAPAAAPVAAPAPAVAPVAVAAPVSPPSAEPEPDAFVDTLNFKRDIAIKPGMLIAEEQPPPRELWEAQKAEAARAAAARAEAAEPPSSWQSLPTPAADEWKSTPVAAEQAKAPAAAPRADPRLGDDE